ncbi:neuronal tyrosine-phosphorylated phosphoinositide-3-kinase adapter 2-like [Syngnathus acus]|uniref:neuronal tyrosine-phosphorylated phosphoinositide-3-kinase adapter 2-like n=1 Tax=Syngnathus acus TaxID=161584 RepID=UPI001885F384|nr:neuronal tyrosine-phosphorylated phosphoinositide-3-kinase adapter 2-like [Syngnathus acus]
MTSREEASTSRRFFQYVEDRCLQAYDELVIQNAADISRESDRVRHDANWTYLQEKKLKKRQGEAIKRLDDEASGASDAAYCGKHLRMGLATVPAAARDGPAAPGLGLGPAAFGVRSHSLDSVGGDPDERKQPPPKPRRDPNTKLSSSSEALATQDEVHVPHAYGGEDWKKTPPPKPKRNPNTQLSSSFDETAHAWNHGKESWLGPDRAGPDESESVYIEMSGNVWAQSGEEQNESVYEEMTYSESCRIPQPFPNLLTHRPPLLLLPPFHPQRSPNSDESPLTPVDVTQLTAPGKKAGPSRDEEEWPPTPSVTSSGRSSAPPLASGRRASSGSAHDGKAYPRSQSACPSPVSLARSRTPVGPKRPPPYAALMAARPPEAGSATSPDDLAKAERRSGRAAEDVKARRPVKASASGTPRDHPALSQMAWPCGDATMMDTIEKKRGLCREIKNRRRADLGDGSPVERRRKQPPPYSAAILWDTAI